MTSKYDNWKAFGLLLAVSFAALAQDVSQEQLAKCAALSSAAEKLACFEALTTVPEQRAPQPAPPEEQRQAVERPAAVESEMSESVVEAAAPAPTPASESPAAAATMAAPAAAPSDVPASPAPSESDELGSEHLSRDERKIEENSVAMATVINVTKSSSGRLYFHFSNGQIWRQIEPHYFSYPRNREFDVSITQGMMNEYRLRVDGKGKMVRVRRVE